MLDKLQLYIKALHKFLKLWIKINKENIQILGLKLEFYQSPTSKVCTKCGLKIAMTIQTALLRQFPRWDKYKICTMKVRLLSVPQFKQINTEDK